jgi:hypothetical protein
LKVEVETKYQRKPSDIWLNKGEAPTGLHFENFLLIAHVQLQASPRKDKERKRYYFIKLNNKLGSKIIPLSYNKC